MKATGIVRRIDDLGRVVIPKEIRRTMRIREGDPLEIFTDREGTLILKKYSPIGELSDFAGGLCESLRSVSEGVVAVCDREKLIAAAGNGKKEVLEKDVSRELEELMEHRTLYQRQKGKNCLPAAEGGTLCLSVAAPILCEGDLLGCVLLLGAPTDPLPEDSEVRLAKLAASVLSHQLSA